MGLKIGAIQLNTMALTYQLAVTCIIEQPRHEAFRVRYDPATGVFNRTEALSLPHARKFRGDYGWIADSGTPPEPHFDVYVLTDIEHQAGTKVKANIAGMFFKADGDHKFVAVADDIISSYEILDINLPNLPTKLRENIEGVYPDLYPGESWLNAEQAIAFLNNNLPESGDLN